MLPARQRKSTPVGSSLSDYAVSFELDNIEIGNVGWTEIWLQVAPIKIEIVLSATSILSKFLSGEPSRSLLKSSIISLTTEDHPSPVGRPRNLSRCGNPSHNCLLCKTDRLFESKMVHRSRIKRVGNSLSDENETHQ
jgi:hypothetical protein